MIFEAKEINEHNFDERFDKLINMWDYNFLLDVCRYITEDQETTLEPHIIDAFITEHFEECEWEGRFRALERAKEVYAKSMCFGEGDKDFIRMKLTNCQDIFISKSYHYDELETLIIPTELFKNTNLAPMEIIVYELKQNWNKKYPVIAKMLNRDQRTIETTVKRAVAKMELMKDGNSIIQM